MDGIVTEGRNGGRGGRREGGREGGQKKDREGREGAEGEAKKRVKTNHNSALYTYSHPPKDNNIFIH